MKVAEDTFARWESLDAVYDGDPALRETQEQLFLRARELFSRADFFETVAEDDQESSVFRADTSGDFTPEQESALGTELDVIDLQLEDVRRSALERIQHDIEVDLERVRSALEQVQSFLTTLEEMETRCTQAQKDLSMFRATLKDAYTKKTVLERKAQSMRERLELWEELERLSQKLDTVEMASLQTSSLDADGVGNDIHDVLVALGMCQERMQHSGALAHSAELAAAHGSSNSSNSVWSATEHDRLEKILQRARELTCSHLGVLVRHLTSGLAMELSRLPADQRRLQAPDREDAIVNLRFRQLSKQTRQFMDAICNLAPADSPETMQFFAKCEMLFVEQRRPLVLPLAQEQARLAASAEELDLAARSTTTMLLKVCTMELQLFQALMLPSSETTQDMLLRVSLGAKAQPLSALRQWLRSIADLISIYILPRVLQESDLDALVRCIDFLQKEAMETELSRSTSDLVASCFTEPVTSLLADTRERTIYRAQLFIRDQILRFQPSDGDLQALYAHFQRPNRGHGPQQLSLEGPNTQPVTSTPSSAVYRATLLTLQVLALLHGRIDALVFAGLSREAIEACIRNLQTAARRLALLEPPASRESLEPDKSSVLALASLRKASAPGQTQGSVQRSPLSSPRLDPHAATSDSAELFYLKQLLILHQNLMLFEQLDIVDQERQLRYLSFDEFRAGVSRIIRGQVSLRHLFGSVRDLIPKRMDLNSKETLRDELRAAYEAVVFRALRELLQPLLVFLAEVAASSNVAALKGEAGTTATVDCVREIWATVLLRFDRVPIDPNLETQPVALRQILDFWQRLFGPHGSRVLTEILRENVQEVLSEFVAVLHRHYSVEERRAVGVDAERVRALMEAFAPDAPSQ